MITDLTGQQFGKYRLVRRRGSVGKGEQSTTFTTDRNTITDLWRPFPLCEDTGVVARWLAHRLWLTLCLWGFDGEGVAS
nr:hypothetical protein [Ktedonobacteraceae bacterium]